MGDIFFPVAGMILAGLGLLLLTAKLLAYIKCTVPVSAVVVKLQKECSHFRGVTHTELCRRHGSQMDSYLDKLSAVHENMERTISFALGESFTDESDGIDSTQIDALQGKRVLLVDDNELNREILEEVLLDHGLLVEEAENGGIAFAAVKEHEPGYYHFILMDIEMPVMDGYETTLKIRKLPNRIRANIPIIAFTANAVSDNRDRAFAVGMDGFLAKPVKTSHLLSSLSKLL